MQILIISNYFSPIEIGGWEQLTHDVSLRLRHRGHQVLVLTSNYRASELTKPESDVSRILHLESPDHIHYHPIYTLYRGRWEAENRQILCQAVAQFKPDLIFVNGMWNLPHSVAKEAERLLPGRVVYYMASYWPTEINAHVAYWADMPAKGWRRWFKQVLGTAVRPLLAATPRYQLDFARVLCVSQFVQKMMVQEAKIPHERTRVVHNGIEPELFTVRPFRLDAPVLRLLYAGRLAPDKGVHTIIESMACLCQKHPDLPILVSLYGGGTPGYEAQLRELAQKLEVADTVQFCGRVPREQMPDVFADHDVLLFPSIWPEPLARTVQEAMACGLVVIGTITGGTPEILFDGENGLTFEAENATMLAEKIALLAANRPWGAKLAQAARHTVEERFTMERMVDQLEENFREIVNNVNHRPQTMDGR